MSLIQVERSYLESVLLALVEAYEVLEKHAEYRVEIGEAYSDTEPVNKEAHAREQVDAAYNTVERLLKGAPEVPKALEPVAIVQEVHMSRYTIAWINGPLPEGTRLYAVTHDV